MVQINESDSEWSSPWFKCPKCKETEIAKGFSYCPHCGERIEWVKNKKSVYIKE